jgi:hypothetical protein
MKKYKIISTLLLLQAIVVTSGGFFFFLAILFETHREFKTEYSNFKKKSPKWRK